jgi:signal transduction histidine kinase/ActR/RegA family two-component response regulator
MRDVLAGDTFLAGSGEMKTRIREFDWAGTTLGPPSQWPTSLRTIVSVLVNTHHPMFLWWGPDLIQFYNDGYLPSFGTIGRHPAALGARGREFWDEIWPAIGPQIAAVMERGECTWNEDHLVPIARNGRVEEVYWTYGYSPVRDDDGRVGGTLVVVQEQTARVLAARRLRTLRDLAGRAAALTEADAWTGAIETLTDNPHDLPWVLMYGVSDDGERVRLVAQSCAADTHAPLHAWRPLDTGGAMRRLLETRESVWIDDVRSFAGERPCAPWPEPVRSASLVPILRPDTRIPCGILVAGLSPRLPFDADYADFLSMVAQQLGATLAAARSHEEEQRRAHALAEQGARFRELFEQAPVGVAVFTGPDHRFEVANAIYLAITHRKALVGLRYTEAFPELAGSEVPEILDRVYRTGEPFVAHAFRTEIDRTGSGDLQEQFFTFHVAPVRGDRSAIVGLMVVAVDVTSHVVARRALVRAQARLDFTLDAAGVGYWDLNLVDETATTSLRHDQILGYPTGVTGWTFERFLEHVAAPERVRVAESFRRIAAAGQDFDAECPIVGADGVARWIQIYGRVERSEHDAPPRCLGIVIDVTERHDLLGREQAARREAEHVSRMKDEFLATVSHELRTPLNTIVGWTDLLSGGGLDPALAAEGLKTMGRNARMQAQMIEDLLDMSRVISGTLRLNTRRVSLPDVVAHAAASVRRSAETKGVQLDTVVRVAPEDGMVSGDPERLEQVFWNLLGNAVKFTHSGGRVQVSVERAGSDVAVVVSDTGEGIAAEFLPHVFDRFRQEDGGSTRAHGGLGLGLSLVKQLVDLHRGTVGVESDGRDRGAMFTVLLPAATAAAEAERAERRLSTSSRPRPESAALLDGVSILLVDDDIDGRELTSRILTAWGAHVVAVGSASDALDTLLGQTFDLLVSDIGMHQQDGYDLIRQVRALPASRGGQIPAVALTAYARAEDRQHALRAGFQVHVAKPIERSELLTVCRSLTARPA